MRYVLVIVCGYIALLIIAYIFVERIVFRPSDIDQNYTYSFKTVFQEVFLTDSEHDLRINALHFQVTNPKGCVLYFHGNTGSLDMWGNAHESFSRRSYDTFIIDYPGYGKSNQRATERSVYTSADMAYDWVRARYDTDDIIVYGRSIGGGPASYIARHQEAQQLILETPFYSMDQVLKHYAPFIFYVVPSKVKLKMNKHIEDLKIPITIIHGTDDTVVPYSSAVQLKALLKPTDLFITVDGGGHNDMMEYQIVHDVLNQRLNN